MALTLTLDYALRQLNEAGYHKEMPARMIANFGAPVADGDWKAIWAEPATQTLMLRPLQLRADWLNTEQQLDSIIRLSDMVVDATDLATKAIFEDAFAGNTNNPYIYHVPVVPSGTLTGVTTPIVNTSQDVTSIRTNNIYTVGATVPPTPTTPTLTGGTADGKFLFHTADHLAANQALYVRFAMPQSQIGAPATYCFYVGQFAITIKDVVVEVHKDTSANGDRSVWTKIFTKPLYSVRDFSLTGIRSTFLAATNPTELLAHDRSLLWLPFRRNQVLLLASTGAYGMLQVGAKPKRLADNSDWDIVKEAEMAVWSLNPAPGRLQIQKVKYQTGAIHVEAPSFRMNYVPASPPTATVTKDADHTTSVTAVIATPAANTITQPPAEDCQVKNTLPSDQSVTYGLTLTLQGSSDGRWSPYFYRLTADSPRTFLTPSTTPLTVQDVSSGDSYVQSATVHSGQKPGDGRLTVKIIDKGTYPLSSYHYRHTIPVQLTSVGTTAFTGISEPNEVVPIKLNARPRQITFSALDLWTLLTHTYFGFNGSKDWTGTGHITAVKEILEIAGYDTTTTPIDTLPITATNDTPLGLGSASTSGAAKADKTVKAGWEPNTGESAADFITRIAEKFSGWMVGFHPDGQFFYHPRNHYTAVEATFSAVHTGSAPYFYDATFRTITPEANVLAVIAGSETDGSYRISPYMIDYASLKNPAAVNYMGRIRQEVVQLTGSYSCRELTYIARRMFDAARRRHLTAEWKGDYVPGLKVGRVVQLGTYGQYRVQEFSAEYVKDRLRWGTYVGELVEAGF